MIEAESRVGEPPVEVGLVNGRYPTECGRRRKTSVAPGPDFQRPLDKLRQPALARRAPNILCHSLNEPPAMRLCKGRVGQENLSLWAVPLHSSRHSFGGASPLRKERLPVLVDFGP
jgi:hypothetical protein